MPRRTNQLRRQGHTNLDEKEDISTTFIDFLTDKDTFFTSWDLARRSKKANNNTSMANVKQILREVWVTDDIQRRIERANATQLKNFHLRLEMDVT